jgi:hypothetical protein
MRETSEREGTGLALEYAPLPPWRRRKAARWVVGAVIAMVAVAVAVKWAPGAWRQGVMLYWQHRCLTYSAPADQVVYEEDSNTSSKLLVKPEYVAAASARGGSPVAVFVPSCARSFGKFFRTAWMFGGGRAVLFMHERRTTSGTRALAIVQHEPIDPAAVPFWPVLGLSSVSVHPASVRGQPVPVIPSLIAAAGGGLGFRNTPVEGLRFYAGQVDPMDESHFTIRYELIGGSGTIDGWLVDVDGAVKMPGSTFIFPKGTRVRLKVRDGPALGTAWVTRAMMKD